MIRFEVFQNASCATTPTGRGGISAETAVMLNFNWQITGTQVRGSYLNVGSIIVIAPPLFEDFLEKLGDNFRCESWTAAVLFIVHCACGDFRIMRTSSCFSHQEAGSFHILHSSLEDSSAWKPCT